MLTTIIPEKYWHLDEIIYDILFEKPEYILKITDRSMSHWTYILNKHPQYTLQLLNHNTQNYLTQDEYYNLIYDFIKIIYIKSQYTDKLNSIINDNINYNYLTPSQIYNIYLKFIQIDAKMITILYLDKIQDNILLNTLFTIAIKQNGLILLDLIKKYKLNDELYIEAFKSNPFVIYYCDFSHIYNIFDFIFEYNKDYILYLDPNKLTPQIENNILIEKYKQVIQKIPHTAINFYVLLNYLKSNINKYKDVLYNFILFIATYTHENIINLITNIDYIYTREEYYEIVLKSKYININKLVDLILNFNFTNEQTYNILKKYNPNINVCYYNSVANLNLVSFQIYTLMLECLNKSSNFPYYGYFSELLINKLTKEEQTNLFNFAVKTFIISPNSIPNVEIKNYRALSYLTEPTFEQYVLALSHTFLAIEFIKFDTLTDKQATYLIKLYNKKLNTNISSYEVLLSYPKFKNKESKKKKNIIYI